MLIRPPVVRSMRRDLWANMMGESPARTSQDLTSEDSSHQASSHQPKATADRLDQLRKLADLHDLGVITDNEFRRMKERILDPLL